MSLSARRSTVLAFAAALLALACAATAATTKKPPPVPGIGPATAEKILQMRKSYGAFKNVDDLLAIRGIGKKRLEKMRKYLTVGHAGSAKPQKPADPSAPEDPKSSNPKSSERQN